MVQYLDLPLADQQCIVSMPSALRCAFSTAYAVLFMEKWCSQMATPFYTICAANHLYKPSKSENRHRFIEIDNVCSHLRGHALRHFGDVLRNQSILFCRLVRLAVCTIVDWYFKRWLTWWSTSSFSSLWRVRRLCLSESLLQERKLETESDFSDANIFRLSSRYRDNDNECWCSSRFLHNST